jgi:hypothetical protein
MQLLQIWTLENSFLQRCEIQSIGAMKEGTVPVPHTAPALKSDDDELPFCGVLELCG